MCAKVAFSSVSFSLLQKSPGDLKGHNCLLRSPQAHASVRLEDGVSLVKQPVQPSKEVTTLAPGHLAPTAQSLRKAVGPVTQFPIEDRLRAMDSVADTLTGRKEDPPRADNLCQLLLQGLQSNDPRLLNSVLDRTDEGLIKNTVRRLPLSSVLSLLKELHKRMHSRGSGVYPYMKWTKAVISTHTSYLMTCQEASTLLSPLLELLEARTEVFEKVCRLRGRVDLILSQVTARHEDSLRDLPTKPLCVIQEESSDDEDMEQDGSEKHETDNLWELSEDGSEARENTTSEDEDVQSGSEEGEEEDSDTA